MGIFLFSSNNVPHVRIKLIEYLLFEWRVVFVLFLEEFSNLTEVSMLWLFTAKTLFCLTKHTYKIIKQNET